MAERLITAQVERFRDLIPEFAPLFPLHYQMLSNHREHGVPLAPQYAEYIRRDEAGVCVTVTLRANGRLVGYWVSFVMPGLHYDTCLTGQMDMFFIHPDYRSGALARRLIRAVEAEMVRRGVRLWFAGEKLHSPVGRLFAAQGFSPVEQIWAKWL